MSLATAVALAGAAASSARAYSYDPQSQSFTLVAIPDPQYYTTVQWKADQYYTKQMQWVVSNASAKNIGFVFGLGDEVQDGNPFTTDASHNITTTYTYNITPSGQTQQVNGAPSIDTVDSVNHNFEAEWVRASYAWGLLDAAGIPNYPIAGNHDYYHWDQKKDPSEFLKYFGPSRYQALKGPNGQPWFGGSSPASSSAPANLQYAGMDTYSYFYAGGYKFLNIALQYAPQSYDFTWAQSILNANPGLPTIISTHDYQDTNGRDSAGNNIWNNFINKAGNSQIFMVLSGHVNGEHYQTSTDADGKSVFEVLSDYQDQSFSGLQNGGGYLRTMSFDLSSNSIHVQTYSPVNNTYLTTNAGTANANDFTLSLNFAQRFGPPPFLAGKSFYWDPGQTHTTSGGGVGTWDAATTADWYDGTAGTAWSAATNTDTAIFGGTAGGAITVAAGGVSVNDMVFKAAGYSMTGGTVTLVGATPTIDVSAAGGSNLTIANVIAGSAGCTVTGGPVTLAASNTFTGGLTIKGGANVTATADLNLGAASSPVTLDGGTFTWLGSSTVTLSNARVFTIGGGGGTFNIPVPAGQTTGKVTINGTNLITGAGDVTKAGAGWLTIYGNNTSASGNWTVAGGVLELGAASAAGTGEITVNSGAELAINLQVNPLANRLTLNAGATVSTDNHTAGGGNYTGAVSAAGNFNVRLGDFWGSTSENVTLSGAITGPGQATIIAPKGVTTSTGTLKLTGDNSSFTGGVVVPTGTLAVGATAGLPLGTGPVVLSGGRLALQGQAVQTGTIAAAPVAVAVSGFNKDVIYAAPDVATGATTTTTMDGSYAFYQTNYIPPAGTVAAGTEFTTGGIDAPSISSAVDNAAYAAHGQAGIKTPFALQSFTANNVLQFAQGSTGTVTLNVPGVYGYLSVLATSGFAANDTPSVVIHFADGTSATTTFKAYDWSINGDATKIAASAFGAAGIERYSATQGWDQRAFSMYESDIDLTNIGGVDYSMKQVTSLTFNAASSDAQGRGKTSIFAVSGAPRGWVASATGQTYANPVTVSADSSIDVSGALTATLGPLTIAGSKLSLTSASTSAAAYSLTFPSATASGNVTLDVANSVGGGAGRLTLASLVASGSLAKSGAGTLALPSGGSVAGPLSITGGSVDLSTGTLNLLAGGTTADALRSLLFNARLTSSAADAAHRLGYLSTPAGLQVRLAWAGDLNLDNTIDADDYALIDRGMLTAGANAHWWDGDLNYDGTVNGADYLLLDTAAGIRNGSLSPELLADREARFGPDYVSALTAAVPEPAVALSALGLIMSHLTIRRRVRR